MDIGYYLPFQNNHLENTGEELETGSRNEEMDKKVGILQVRDNPNGDSPSLK